MQLQISGHHIDVGDALKGYVTQVLHDVTVNKFNEKGTGTVIFSRIRHQFTVEIILHPQKNITLQAHSKATDAYAAFDMAADKIRKRIYKYRDRLINKSHERTNERMHDARHYVLHHDHHDEAPSEEDAQPTIVAEMEAPIFHLTVSEAVMQLDLIDSNALVFKNKAHGGINIIYRRNDGNIGWIDPSAA